MVEEFEIFRRPVIDLIFIFLDVGSTLAIPLKIYASPALESAIVSNCL